MPNNKSGTAKAKNSEKGNSSGQEHGRESSRGERHGNTGEHQKQDHGFKRTGRNVDSSDGVKNIARGRNLKDGCLPKLFMLFLPFMAVGTFFFFKSIAS